jgi:hypothetical protein
MNVTTLTDEELDQLRVDILTEQDRRHIRATTPQTVADLTARFIADGGEKATLDAAVMLKEVADVVKPSRM